MVSPFSKYSKNAAWNVNQISLLHAGSTFCCKFLHLTRPNLQLRIRSWVLCTTALPTVPGIYACYIMLLFPVSLALVGDGVFEPDSARSEDRRNLRPSRPSLFFFRGSGVQNNQLMKSGTCWKRCCFRFMGFRFCPKGRSKALTRLVFRHWWWFLRTFAHRNHGRFEWMSCGYGMGAVRTGTLRPRLFWIAIR